MTKAIDPAPGYYIVRGRIGGKPRYILMQASSENPLILTEIRAFIEHGEAAKHSHLLYNQKRGVTNAR